MLIHLIISIHLVPELHFHYPLINYINSIIAYFPILLLLIRLRSHSVVAIDHTHTPPLVQVITLP